MSRVVVVLTDAECQSIRERYEQPLSLVKLHGEFGYSLPVLANAIKQAGGKIRSRGRIRIPPVSPTFKNKLAILESQLQKPLNEEVLMTLVDYVLGFNDGRTFRKIDRRYGYEGVLSQFRKDHLEASYYVMGRLWRAVYRSVTRKNVNLASFGVAEKDVQICLNALTPENLRKIRLWVKNTKYVVLPNEKGVHAVVEACEKAMKSIVNSKLRFIYQYDPCYEREDLISFLRIIAYRVALKYDWEMVNGKFAFEKCLNYTKRSMWNAAYLLIKQNTSDDYRRLAKIDTDQRLYQITTISMDSPVDDEWLHIQKRLGEPEDRSIEVLDLANAIGKKNPNFFTFLRLEVEDTPEFTEFVMRETGEDENDLYTDNFNKWRDLAMFFSGITRTGQRRAIKRRALKEMGLWDRSRMNKPGKSKKARKPKIRSSK